jgi:AcrR family transcriptional regulator
MADEDEIGLRERKKIRTRETIVSVAMELFDEHGFQATTIPTIAEAADVSPRTVSTYFPSKEDIVFALWAGQKESLGRRLRDRASGESTIEAIRAWLLEERIPRQKRSLEIERQRRVIDSDPWLQSIERNRFHEFAGMLSREIAADLRTDEDAIEPRLAATALVGIFTLLSDERFRPDPIADPEKELPRRLLDRGLAFVAGGIAALVPAPGSDRE